MNKKMVLKVAWIGITCLAVLASCVRMEANTVRVHAEDATEPPATVSDDWDVYLEGLQLLLAEAGAVSSKTNAIMMGTEIAIANTIPLATASDVSVFNGVTELIGDYKYADEWAVEQYVLCHIGGNSRVRFSDALHQENIIEYPWGSQAYYTFVENGSMWLACEGGACKIYATNLNTVGYTEPDATIAAYPFEIWYGGGSPDTCVTKYRGNELNKQVLCSFISLVAGSDHRDFYNWYVGTEHGFLLPEVSTELAPHIQTNEYLTMVYDKFEEDFGVSFEYSLPDLVPVGTLLPDGSIQGGDQSGGEGDINVNVNVEFPTHLVPDVPEPETYDYSDISEHDFPLADEGVVKQSWLDGYSAFWGAVNYCLDSFHLRETIVLLLCVCVFIYLIVRY